MNLPALIKLLSQPAAFPFPVDAVVVHQTHISAVFLAGAFAYKVKKPVDFGFLDFSTLEKRRHFCEEEVRLNRRLAPEVYLGVVPVTAAGVEAAGDVVDWAVKMQRLPEAATFADQLLKGTLDAAQVRMLAARLAAFHRTAERSVAIADKACFAAVAKNVRQIYTQSTGQVGLTVSQAVFDRLQALSEGQLATHRALIEQRAEQGIPCDCHGDLHLDHVYHFPERIPPGDLVIVDCIEFTERFRHIDPVADMAFPVMDFAFYNRRDLGAAFADSYFAAADDAGGRPLLPLYTAYRATVRGSVRGMKLAEKEVSAAERAVDLQEARAHWLVGLGALEEPPRRPTLLLIAGLPGTGKSSLARAVADRAGFQVIRSDEVRKVLTTADERYSPAATARTYAECQRRAEELLFAGQRVLVDANFRVEAQRQAFLDAGRRWGVPALLCVCQADATVIQQRLAARRGDVSDADWQVYQQVAQEWEPPQAAHVIDTSGALDAGVAQVMRVLEAEHLAGPIGQG